MTILSLVCYWLSYLCSGWQAVFQSLFSCRGFLWGTWVGKSSFWFGFGCWICRCSWSSSQFWTYPAKRPSQISALAWTSFSGKAFDPDCLPLLSRRCALGPRSLAPILDLCFRQWSSFSGISSSFTSSLGRSHRLGLGCHSLSLFKTCLFRACSRSPRGKHSWLCSSLPFFALLPLLLFLDRIFIAFIDSFSLLVCD